MRTSRWPYVYHGISQNVFPRSPLTLTVSSTSLCTLPASRVSTAIAVACPPASLISLSTVLIVDCWEFGSGGNVLAAYASLVVFAATTTVYSGQKRHFICWWCAYLRIRSLPSQWQPASQFLEMLPPPKLPGESLRPSSWVIQEYVIDAVIWQSELAIFRANVSFFIIFERCCEVSSASERWVIRKCTSAIWRPTTRIWEVQ